MTRRLHCQHCQHVWDYSGGSDFYACCPVCGYKVNIQKRTVNKDIPVTPKATYGSKRHIKEGAPT